MPLATINFHTGERKQTGERDVAIKAYKAKHGQLELTPQQAAYTEKIKSVTLPPSWQNEVDNYQPVIIHDVQATMRRPDGLSSLRDVNTRSKETNALGGRTNGFSDSYENKMTNLGVEQGLLQSMPRHDRE